MRRIVAGLYVSLDGVTESPEKWTFPYFNDEVGQVVASQMAEADAGLLGRRTYQEFAAYWPNQTADDNPFADYINNLPKFVVSTTLKSVEWRNSTLITGDVAGQLTQLKQQPGKNISVTGSAPGAVAAARRTPRRAAAPALSGRGGHRETPVRGRR